MTSKTRAPRAAVGDQADERRQQILHAARAAIEEHGPQALTGQIASRAGLARPNFYRHFASKSELDLALARSAYHELRAAIRTRLRVTGTPLDAIRAPIAAQVAWAEAHPNLYRFLVSRGHQRSAENPRATRSAFAAEIAEAAARYIPRFGQDPDAADATIVAILGMVDASVLWWLDRRTDTRERLVERLTTQAWLLFDNRLQELGLHLDPTAPLPTPPRATDR